MRLTCDSVDTILDSRDLFWWALEQPYPGPSGSPHRTQGGWVSGLGIGAAPARAPSGLRRGRAVSAAAVRDTGADLPSLDAPRRRDRRGDVRADGYWTFGVLPAGCITSPPGGPTARPRRRYTPAVRDTFPRYLGCAAAGGRWVRVDLETGSTFVSAAFGLSWAHDGPRRLMRMSCADGRELSASTSPTRRSTVWSRPPGPASIGRRGLSGSVPPELRFVREELSDAGYAPVVTGGVHLVSEYCCSPCHGDDSGTRGPAQPATRTTRVTNPDSSARARLASRTFSAKPTPCRQSSRSSGYAARTAHGTDAQGLRGCPRATSPDPATPVVR